MAGLGARCGKRRRGWKMPVHSRGDKKETNHHDEMEVDYAENEGSSSEDEDTESSSVSEDGDSSGAQTSRAGTLSPSAGLATGRFPHAGQLRPAGRAGRGEGRGGDWLPALGSTRTVAGRCLAPGGSRWARRGRTRAWACPAPGRCAVLLAVGSALGTSRQCPGLSRQAGNAPQLVWEDPGNSSSPQTKDLFP